MINERELLREWQNNHNIEARNKLVEGNINLVRDCVYKRYATAAAPGTLDVEDLVQEGTLGLMHAADTFDLNMPNAFSTYASEWIRHYVTRALDNQSRTIRIPANQIDKLRKGEANFQPREMDSLDRKITSDESEATVGDFIEDKNFQIDGNLLASDRRKVIKTVLETLNETEQKVLILRFGLSGNDPMTLEETARAIGYSKERVRQYESKALRKLRQPCRANILKEIK